MSSSYRKNFGPDSVEELRGSINSTHEEFLREDDPDKKGDVLRCMSAFAMQFLYLVPHDKKFISKKTERVLHQSAMNISDFDPREASVAFEYLARYAHNILDQPWRKDFHTIKLTSGFYVHNVSSQLTNAHEILVEMGYAHVNEVTLTVTANLSERKLKEVSRDMIVASQECLILSQIWQRVADQEPDYPLTIGEVFEFRLKHLGDTDTICKIMISDIRRRTHEAKMQHDYERKTGRNFVPVDKLIEYEGMEVEGKDVPDTRRGEHEEVHLVEKVLRNTRLLHEKSEEHIYDPVYPGPPISNGISNPNYPSYSTYPHHASSAFVPANPNRLQTRDTVNPPMIPKTATSSFTNPSNSTYNSNTYSSLSSTSSMSSGKPSRHSYNQGQGSNMPLKFSKVPPPVVEEHRNRDKDIPGQTVSWTQLYGDQPGQHQSHQRRRYSERPMPDQFHTDAGRSRKPIMPGDVYPDNYFPRVAKPTPVHSYQSDGNSQFTYNSNRPYQREESNGDEDLMNEALAYVSEVNGPNKKFHSTSTNTKLSSLSDRSSHPHSKFTKEKPTPPGPETKPNLSNRPANLVVKSRSSSTSSPSPSPKTPLRSPISGEPSLADLYYQGLLNRPGRRDEEHSTTYLEERQSQDQLRSNTASSTSSYSSQSERRDLSTMKSETESKHNYNRTNKFVQDKQIGQVQSPVQEVTKIEPWDCRFCTLKNTQNERICEVCAKSKDFVEEDKSPVSPDLPPAPAPPVLKLYSQVVSNSKQVTPEPKVKTLSNTTDSKMVHCPKCTFLNYPGMRECEACEHRIPYP